MKLAKTVPIRVAWTTVSNGEEARTLANVLLEAGAACIQIDPGVQSLYTWQGKRHEDPEIRLWIKYAPEREQALQVALTKHHPYDCPQWIAVDASAVLPAYAEWINKQGP